jgi:hypothetical protein
MKMLLLLIILSVTGCVNGEWGTPDQQSAPEGTVNLVEFNF